MMKEKTTDVGVIIGRFQVHELHEAHISLINTVAERHDAVIIFVGLTPLRGSTSDPLDFAARKRMIHEVFPDIEVMYIEDKRSDDVWSKNLDYQIDRFTKPHQTVTLYGSRDSFIPHYTGKFKTVELESAVWVSGTEIRKRIANNFKPTKDFRAGVIAGTFNQYPVAFPTVDIAIVDRSRKMVLMVKKPDEGKLRFCGGFATPDSDSYEQDAYREAVEETSVEIGEIIYIGSKKINDWRYRNSTNKIKTHLYIATYIFGRPEGKDDVESAHWVSIKDLLAKNVPVVEEHEPLVEMFHKYIATKDVALLTDTDKEETGNDGQTREGSMV